MNSEEQNQLDKARAEQFLAETPLIEGIESVGVEFGEDFTGDPALWLVFHLAPQPRGKNGLDMQEARRLNNYASILQRKILDSDLHRFPFTKWKRAA